MVSKNEKFTGNSGGWPERETKRERGGGRERERETGAHEGNIKKEGEKRRAREKVLVGVKNSKVNKISIR